MHQNQQSGEERKPSIARGGSGSRGGCGGVESGPGAFVRRADGASGQLAGVYASQLSPWEGERGRRLQRPVSWAQPRMLNAKQGKAGRDSKFCSQRQICRAQRVELAAASLLLLPEGMPMHCSRVDRVRDGLVGGRIGCSLGEIPHVSIIR